MNETMNADKKKTSGAAKSLFFVREFKNKKQKKNFHRMSTQNEAEENIATLVRGWGGRADLRDRGWREINKALRQDMPMGTRREVVTEFAYQLIEKMGVEAVRIIRILEELLALLTIRKTDLHYVIAGVEKFSATRGEFFLEVRDALVAWLQKRARSYNDDEDELAFLPFKWDGHLKNESIDAPQIINGLQREWKRDDRRAEFVKNFVEKIISAQRYDTEKIEAVLNDLWQEGLLTGIDADAIKSSIVVTREIVAVDGTEGYKYDERMATLGALDEWLISKMGLNIKAARSSAAADIRAALIAHRGDVTAAAKSMLY